MENLLEPKKKIVKFEFNKTNLCYNKELYEKPKKFYFSSLYINLF